MKYILGCYEKREEIAEAPIEIFKSLLAVSELTDDWRTANVVSLFKKRSSSNPDNSRPLSLLSVLGKLSENNSESTFGMMAINERWLCFAGESA